MSKPDLRSELTLLDLLPFPRRVVACFLVDRDRSRDAAGSPEFFRVATRGNHEPRNRLALPVSEFLGMRGRVFHVKHFADSLACARGSSRIGASSTAALIYAPALFSLESPAGVATGLETKRVFHVKQSP